MAENGKIQDYAYLDKLSTEELEELLRADVGSLERSNEDVIFHILEVIEKREKEHPTGRLPDVDKSWEDFQKYYNTPEGDGLSLYPSERQSDSSATEYEPIPFRATKKRRRRRILISVAAVICLVVLLMPPALGYANIFEMIGYWTAEQFSFTDATESTDSQPSSNQTEGEYSSFQEALDHYGIDDAVVPQYIPDGFKLQKIWVQEYSGKGDVEFTAPYLNGDDNIIITIILHSGQVDRIYEKNSQDVEQYMAGNVVHYIFQNINNVTAAWYVDSLECSISTNLSVTELEKIIDSIYEE
jgi:hypothetical protein